VKKTRGKQRETEGDRAVGWLEIAGICGLILGATARKIPVVVDGFISSAGALVACRMTPAVKDYLFFSHAVFPL